MGKKDFKEKIKDDFKTVGVAPVEEEASSKTRTKAVPGARLISISDVFPDPNQPRKKFDQEKLDELVASIKSKGIIEPITVRFIEEDNYYRIVTGERRYKAAQLAGLEEIPCIVKHLSDQEVLAYQLIENLQREDLSPIDEATALKRLLENGFTQVEVSRLIGKSQPYISQALKILQLPQSILDEAEKTNVSKEHLLQLVKSEKPENIWQGVKEGGRTAKEIKEEVRKEKPARGRPKNFCYTFRPKGKPYKIIVQFNKPEAKKEEIKAALNEALESL